MWDFSSLALRCTIHNPCFMQLSLPHQWALHLCKDSHNFQISHHPSHYIRREVHT
nr:hypothetical protein Iba_chr03cCG5210 [Ipomoea batatas]